METKESMNKKQVLDINPDHLLDFTCELGILLLRNGAEIYRVEESVQRVLEIYGMSGINVFAIPSLILINFSADGHNYSKSVRVRGTINNMERLNRLNALCRDICGGVLDFEQATRELHEIEHCPLYPRWASYLAYGAAAFFFTLFWGGTAWDAAAALVAGLTAKLAVNVAAKCRTNLFFSNVVAGCFLAVVPILCHTFYPAYFQFDKIIIGTIMLLVPGVAIANVIRDVLAGDTLTALTKFTEVLIIGLGIAIGIAIPMSLLKALFAAIG